MIRTIVAMDDARGIAVPNNPPYNIPWQIPEDSQYFKQVTMGATVLMGGGTYKTLTQALPGRRNVVLSSTLQTVKPGFELVQNLSEFLNTIADDVWIIGGGELYKSALPFCQELYLTHVSGNYECNVFFPEYEDDFTQISRTSPRQSAGHEYYTAIYKRP